MSDMAQVQVVSIVFSENRCVTTFTFTLSQTLLNIVMICYNTSCTLLCGSLVKSSLASVLSLNQLMV